MGLRWGICSNVTTEKASAKEKADYEDWTIGTSKRFSSFRLRSQPANQVDANETPFRILIHGAGTEPPIADRDVGRKKAGENFR